MNRIPVIVYGAGGLGREVMQMVMLTLAKGDEYEALGYVDDGVVPGTILNGFPVLGSGDYLEKFDGDVALVFGIADSDIKDGLYSTFKDKLNIKFPNVIHPSASVSECTSLGSGIVIAHGCFISVDTVIGDCVFMNNSTLVGHDTQIGDFTSIMSLVAISGNVTIGARCLIGVQSAIRQGFSVGDAATVGMGSVVLRNVPDGATVLGNPARRVL